MAYKVALSPIAHENIDEAIGYYNEKGGFKIAEAFYQDLQNCYKELEINPFHQIRIKKYRAVPLKKFPYLLFFEIDEKEMLVRVLAVFNTNQNPKNWP